MTDVLATLTPLFATRDSPALGPQRRDSALPLALAQKQIGELIVAAGLSGVSVQLVRSLALLWHDHLAASHEISQGVHTVDGSYLHGLMHRRELDFGNAAYWFRRVGEHPIFPELARAVAELTTASEFKAKLTAGDRWQPLAMIDACEAVEVAAAEVGDAEFLREAQALEFRFLLKHLAELGRCS